MKQSITIAAAAFLVTAAALKAGPALAEPSSPELNVALVHTADLDLSTQSGQRQLDSRLVRAAREVCGSASDADLVGKNQVRQCRSDVLARANAQRDQLLASRGGGGIIAVTAAR